MHGKVYNLRREKVHKEKIPHLQSLSLLEIVCFKGWCLLVKKICLLMSHMCHSMYQQILRYEVPILNILANLEPYFMNPFDGSFILACNGSYIVSGTLNCDSQMWMTGFLAATRNKI